MCYKYKVLYISQIHWDGLVKYNMYMGVFHSTKISVDIWKRALSFEIPLKYTEVFRNFLSGIPVPFDFLPEFSVECFFWKFNNFQIFWNLSQEITLPIVPFRNFRNFCLNRNNSMFTTITMAMAPTAVVTTDCTTFLLFSPYHQHHYPRIITTATDHLPPTEGWYCTSFRCYLCISSKK